MIKALPMGYFFIIESCKLPGSLYPTYIFCDVNDTRGSRQLPHPPGSAFALSLELLVCQMTSVSPQVAPRALKSYEFTKG